MSESTPETLSESTPETSRGKSSVQATADQQGVTDQPDVLLDVPQLKVDEIHLEVDSLQAHVSVLAEVLTLLRLQVGVDVSLQKVSLDIKGVEAAVTLKARLDEVAAIIDRVMKTIDDHPEILADLASGLGQTLRGLGQGSAGTLAAAGQGARSAAESVGQGAGSAVQSAGGDAGQAAGEVRRDAGDGGGTGEDNGLGPAAGGTARRTSSQGQQPGGPTSPSQPSQGGADQRSAETPAPRNGQQAQGDQ